MKRLICQLVLIAALGASTTRAADAEIIKVLPHYLDLEGRHTLAPSLYERDAYQARLRKHRDECSGLRFDVQFRTATAPGATHRLRLELRTGQSAAGKPLVIERTVRSSGLFARWDSVSLTGEEFKKSGDVAAWRATLWLGDALVAEQKSFLW